MPGTITFKELMEAHLTHGTLNRLHIHPVMLHDVFDLEFEEAKAITDELGLVGEPWFCTWGHNKRDDTYKEGTGIIVSRK